MPNLSKTECIFKPRCKKCDNLILKSEKHKCSKSPVPQKSKRLFLEIYGVFEELQAISLLSSEIYHYLNKKYDSQKFTSYEIRWHMDQKPDIFAVDTTRQYRKYQEKRYCCLIGNSTNKDNFPEKTSPVTSVRYYINPPRTRWALTHSIKKETTHGTVKSETTLAMVYGEELAKSLLQKCKELNA
jgi:hypothetical protein